MIRRIVFLLLALAIVGPTLAACGKKPAELEPPVGEQSDFPRKYPR
jgi:predicted small lipoprotein YifL